MEPFIGEIRLFAGTYAPKGWAECGGQELTVREHPTLFSIIGKKYGGDGRTTFALPDLRGCAAVGAGQGPGLSAWPVGWRGGDEDVTLGLPNLPLHTHSVATYASNAETDLAEAGGDTLFLSRYKVKGLPNLAENFRSPSIGGDTVNVYMAAQSIGETGGSQPHENMQPYLTMRYCIALEGVYPPKP
ncbi:phage tail protein [Ancylobacter rudongensis]|uniref:Microcystin-dependent protein n=1 Tax=Ancylobacter rudongensis TaxID=177413 RepID=A0A1G4QLN4_9HYPH|nr:tail fiber protein [Ancylobacter rudongensis]SCW45367.1 Microcystin-dependent protein [Ancylobacter rudongensis]